MFWILLCGEWYLRWQHSKEEGDVYNTTRTGNFCKAQNSSEPDYCERFDIRCHCTAFDSAFCLTMTLDITQTTNKLVPKCRLKICTKIACLAQFAQQLHVFGCRLIFLLILFNKLESFGYFNGEIALKKARASEVMFKETACKCRQKYHHGVLLMWRVRL